MTNSPRNNLRFLLALVFFSRLVFALIIWKVNGAAGFLSIDTASYVEPAESLMHGSFFRFGVPEIFRTPGYPVLLLPGIAMHHPVALAILENLILATLSAWLIWKIVNAVLPNTRAAFWAVVLYCLEPIEFLNAEKVLTETAFTTFFLLSVWLLVRFFGKPRHGALALSALALGAATYVRPISLYLGVYLALVLLFLPANLPWRRRVANAILFPVIFGLLLLPWTIRNLKVADYTAFCATPDLNVYAYVGAAVEAKLAHKSLDAVQKESGVGPYFWASTPVDPKGVHKSFAWVEDDSSYAGLKDYFDIHPDQRNWSQGEIVRFRRALGSKTVASHLGTYFMIHAKGCVAVLFNPGVTELLRDTGVYPLYGSPVTGKIEQGQWQAALWLFREYPATIVLIPVMTLQVLLYYVLALAGVRWAPRDLRWLLIALALYFVVFSGIPGALSRWRVPLMPIVCMSAGIAIAHYRARKVERTAV